MTGKNDGNPGTRRRQLNATIPLIALAVFIVAFLVVVDQKRWFELRPATGTAAAMYQAGDREAPVATATR